MVPVTFVDGSSGVVLADPALGIQHMSVQVYSAGGLGGIDRTLDFRHGDGSSLMGVGPLETYTGGEGTTVELWRPSRDFPARCPHLVYSISDWFVGVRTCQDTLEVEERRRWARLLTGTVTRDGWLVLTARPPLRLAAAGETAGPESIFGQGRSNWIQLQPGRCRDAVTRRAGRVREMPDGTIVAFSRMGGSREIRDDWTVTWCEDGRATIQVSQAYERFARAAARGLRMRDVVLARG